MHKLKEVFVSRKKKVLQSLLKNSTFLALPYSCPQTSPKSSFPRFRCLLDA